MHSEGYFGSGSAWIAREKVEVPCGSASEQAMATLVSTLWVCDSCDNRTRVYSRRSEHTSAPTLMMCANCGMAVRMPGREQAEAQQPVSSSGASRERCVSAFAA